MQSVPLDSSWGWTVRGGHSVQSEFHSLVRSCKSEGFVEPPCFWALLVRGELKKVAATFLRSRYGPGKEFTAKTRTPHSPVNADTLNRGPPTTLMRDVRREGQLQDSDSGAVRAFKDDKLVVRVLLNRFQRQKVGIWQGIGKPLSLGAQRIVGEHTNDEWKIAYHSGTHSVRRLFHTVLEFHGIDRVHEPCPVS